MTPLDAARDALARGYAPIPVPARSKVPDLKGWQDLRLDDSGLREHFKSAGRNVGGLLGEPSGGLVDVDLDAVEARAIADTFLPTTRSAWGRASSPRSHRAYRVTSGAIPRTTRFQDPDLPDDDDRSTLVELRGTGGQTLLPGSVHPSGEAVEWHGDGRPTDVDADALRRAVATLAAAALLARHWHKGARHDTTLALSGALLRRGWAVERVSSFIEAVAHAAGDDEVGDRLEAVRTTAARLAAGEPASGVPTLARLLGDAATRRLVEWLGLDREPEPAAASPSAGGLRLLRRDDIYNAPPPVWLVENYLHRASVALLYAPPESFKSFICLELALDVATGRDFYGNRAQRGNVLYIVGEGASGLQLRMRAWEAARGVLVPDQFAAFDRPIDLLDPASVGGVLSIVREGMDAPPALVIVDTLSRNFGQGVENSNDDMRRAVEACDRIKRETGACVLLVHHPAGGTEEPRGGTALPGALDTSLYVRRKGDRLTLEFRKQKDAPHGPIDPQTGKPLPPLPLMSRRVPTGLVDDDGRPRYSLVFDRLDSDVAAKLTLQDAAHDISKTARAMVEALRGLGPSGGLASEWERACADRGIPRRTFYDYRKTLATDGVVRQQGKLYTCTVGAGGAK